jgi:hypothetical protein
MNNPLFNMKSVIKCSYKANVGAGAVSTTRRKSPNFDHQTELQPLLRYLVCKTELQPLLRDLVCNHLHITALEKNCLVVK